MTVLDRFLKYVTFDTQSNEETGTTPSTPGQRVFAEALVKELEAIGMEEISLDENSYVMATLPANTDEKIPTIGFTSSKSPLELITRQIIKELEGDENKNLEKYATTGSPGYDKMVSIIAERFGLSSLKFNTLETLIEAIGLPKCKVCTHCFDGSSHF